MDQNPLLYSAAILAITIALNLLISKWVLRHTKSGDRLTTNWDLNGNPLVSAPRETVARIYPTLIAIVGASLLLFQYMLGNGVAQVIAIAIVTLVFTAIHGVHMRIAVRALRRQTTEVRQ